VLYFRMSKVHSSTFTALLGEAFGATQLMGLSAKERVLYIVAATKLGRRYDRRTNMVRCEPDTMITDVCPAVTVRQRVLLREELLTRGAIVLQGDGVYLPPHEEVSKVLQAVLVYSEGGNVHVGNMVWHKPPNCRCGACGCTMSGDDITCTVCGQPLE
jgi:hypothetical protein